MSAGGGGGDRSVWSRLLRRDPMEEGDEELRFHMEMRMRDYMEDGMSRDEAREAARKRMGDMARVRRAMTDVAQTQSRRQRRREWIGEIRQDLRYAVRTLLRAPAFASVSTVTLAVGIGATVAIFSLVHAILLAPLPYSQPDRLVRVWETSPQGDARNVVSSGNVVDWQQRARSFTVLGAHGSPYPQTLTGDGEATRVVVAVLQPEVTRALDIAPVLGRSFVERDGVDGNVALISHAIWTTRYGTDPDILGRPAVLNEIPYTIVGVMPPEFDFPNDEVDFWLPLTDTALDPNERTSHNFAVLGRLAAGVSVERAQAEMVGIARQIATEHPSQMTGWSARVVPLHEDITRNVDTLLWLLFGGVVVVLLITCGNLANLLLARAVTRAREMAVRGALGAGRGRILRQLLTESMVLAFFGGLGAVALAPLLERLLVSTAPPGVPLLGRAGINGPVMGFAALAALGSSMLFGLAPALRLSRSDVASSLRSGRDAGQSGDARLRGGLLIAQVSLSVMLLVGAGLFVRSFRALQSMELGFEPEGLVVMDVDLPSPRYPEIASQAAFYDRLLERVRAQPGIVAATTTSQPPGAASGMTFSFGIEGRIATNPSGREDDETLHAIAPGYFDVLGQRIVDGRGFDGRDGAEGPPVVILNESLARKHFPDGDAVGHRIAFRIGDTPWREIVGVVEDARLASPDVEPDPSIFIPFAQKTWPWLTWSSVVARTSPGVDPAQASTALRSALLELDPELPPQSIRTVTSAFRANTARRTFAMTLVTGFGLLALLLSVIGLYGLLSYSVARQSREIGVRIALGAGAADVLGRVLRRSLFLTLVGSLTGVVAAAGASRLIESLLFGVSTVDGATYAATVGLVLVVALGTAALPALRALRTDPLRALRTE